MAEKRTKEGLVVGLILEPTDEPVKETAEKEVETEKAEKPKRGGRIKKN